MTEFPTESDDSELAAAYRRLISPEAGPVDPVGRVRSRIASRRRHLVQLRWGIASVVVVVALLAVVAWQLVPTAAPEVPAATSSTAPAGPNASGPNASGPISTGPISSGPISSGQAASCAFSYGRKTLADREWAADATVSKVRVTGDTAAVSLHVNRWYRGGSDSGVVAKMSSPEVAEDAPPAYRVGTRMLISGDRDGTTYLGWSCGFSRYYDKKTASVWMKVFR